MGLDIVEFDNSIVLDGDVIANGTTGSTTLTRLATVNEDVGTFGSTTKFCFIDCRWEGQNYRYNG